MVFSLSEDVTTRRGGESTVVALESLASLLLLLGEKGVAGELGKSGLCRGVGVVGSNVCPVLPESRCTIPSMSGPCTGGSSSTSEIVSRHE